MVYVPSFAIVNVVSEQLLGVWLVPHNLKVDNTTGAILLNPSFVSGEYTWFVSYAPLIASFTPTGFGYTVAVYVDDTV